MKFSNGQLEYNHNYIQWLFPLQEYSEYDSLSPVLTNSDMTKKIFRDSITNKILFINKNPHTRKKVIFREILL